MDPNKKLELSLWTLLQDIEYQRIAMGRDKFVFDPYSIPDAINKDLDIFSERGMSLLSKLQEKEVIIWSFEPKSSIEVQRLIREQRLSQVQSMDTAGNAEDIIEDVPTSDIWVQMGPKYEEVYRGYSDRFESSEGPPETDSVEARLVKDGRDLYIQAIKDGRRLHIATLRPYNRPDIIMGYLLFNRLDAVVTRAEMKRDIEDLADLNDIGEVIRGIGIDSKIRNLFFRQLGRDAVQLNSTAKTPLDIWKSGKRRSSEGNEHK